MVFLRFDSGAGTKIKTEMERYNNILCISGSELIISEENPEGLMSLNTYSSLCKRGQLQTVVWRYCHLRERAGAARDL